jgi:hypothetical protein
MLLAARLAPPILLRLTLHASTRSPRSRAPPRKAAPRQSRLKSWVLVGKLGRVWVPKQTGRLRTRLVLDRWWPVRRPLPQNDVPLGQTRHLLKLQYQTKRDFHVLDVTAASRMVQPIGYVAPGFPLPAFSRQVLFHELADISQRTQRRDGRYLERPRQFARPIRAGQLGYSSRQLNAQIKTGISLVVRKQKSPSDWCWG